MASDVNSNIDIEKVFQSFETPYIVFGVDAPDYTVLEQNEAHVNLLSGEREDYVGKPLLEAFPDNSPEFKKTGKNKLIETIKEVVRTKKPLTDEDFRYDLIDSDGIFSKKIWAVTHSPVLDSDGEVTAVYQSTRDITDRREAEERLRSTRYQLDQALANGSIGTWVWDMRKNVVIPDQNLAELFGYTVKEAHSGLPLERFIEGIYSADRKRVAAEISKALKSHKPYEAEYRTRDLHGNIRWVIARGQVEFDSSGQPESFPGVIVDITDRKNIENRIQFLTKATTLFASSLSYMETLNNIAATVVPELADWCLVDMFNDEGNLQTLVIENADKKLVAKAKKSISIDATRDLSLDTNLGRVVHHQKAEIFSRITEDALGKSGRSKDSVEFFKDIGIKSAMLVPMVIKNKTIGTIAFICTVSDVVYQQNDLDLAVDLASRAAFAIENARLYEDAQHEISERKKWQLRVEEVNDELESRVKTRTSQLEQTNNGLKREILKRHRAEKALQEYSRELTRSNQELQDFAYVASHDLQEPLRKIQSFGDLLESEYGELLGDGKEYLDRMRNAASRMSTLIQDLLAFSRVTTKAHESVEVKLADVVRDVIIDLEDRIERTEGTVTIKTLPNVFADPTHMRQLFQNLIGNALKFHREGVPPIVEVSTKPIHKTDDMVTITVKDNGIGFDEKYLDRIFSVFQRLHGREAYEGTGIGLAVCRKIVERYNGTITAESIHGKGSKFIITLPNVSKGKTL